MALVAAAASLPPGTRIELGTFVERKNEIEQETEKQATTMMTTTT